MVGLVGTDAYVARLEQELLPVIRESGHPCTLVNASGRIVASTDSRRATGALLRLDGLGRALAPLHDDQCRPPCGALRRRRARSCRAATRRSRSCVEALSGRAPSRCRVSALVSEVERLVVDLEQRCDRGVDRRRARAAGGERAARAP